VFYVLLSGVTKNYNLTGCDAASLDEWLPTFRRDLCAYPSKRPG